MRLHAPRSAWRRFAAAAGALALAGGAWTTVAVTAAPAASASPAGGPVVLDGMDPVCHHSFGEATGGYIRTVLSSLYAGASRDNDGSIAVLGAGSGDTQCFQTFGAMMPGLTSTITPSPTVNYYGDSTSIGQLFTDIAAGTAKPKLLYIPDYSANYSASSPDSMALTANAAGIADFVNSGGALFASKNAYGWLTALLPGAGYNNASCVTTPTVTSDGLASFPSLTDPLVASCWHGYFTGNVGSMRSLVAAPYPTNTDPAVAIAIGGASVTLPSSFTTDGPTGPVATGAAQHVTATVKNGSGVVQPGVTVSFTVTSGPDSGATGTAVSDNSGVATWALTGAARGTDVIVASATVGGSPRSATTGIQWLPRAAAPTVHVTAGNGTLRVETAPASADAGNDLDAVTVALSPGGASQVLPAAGGTASFTGLTNGTAYTATVVAHNAIGDGTAATAAATPRPPVSVPAAPRIAVTPKWYSVVVKVSSPSSNGGGAISGYHVTIHGPGVARRLTVTGATGGTVTLNGLTVRTGYAISVVALTSAGPSPQATASVTTMSEPKPLPIPTVGSRQLEPGQSAVLTGDGLYPLNSATLSAAGRTQVSALARSLRNAKAVRCEGYTDLSSNPTASWWLGLSRAQQVCNTLRAFGVHASTSLVSYGNSRPAVTHGTWKDRAPNRRVVVFVAK